MGKPYSDTYKNKLTNFYIKQVLNRSFGRDDDSKLYLLMLLIIINRETDKVCK